MNIRAHLIVSGRVHNVGYRAHCSEEAKRLGVTGMVRNLADGRVEVFVEGEPDAAHNLAEWCKTGSPFSAVTNVERREQAPLGDRQFRVIS